MDVFNKDNTKRTALWITSIIVAAILGGFLSPVGTALWKNISPERRIEFQITDVINLGSQSAFRMKLSNKGENVERNIKIKIKKSAKNARTGTQQKIVTSPENISHFKEFEDHYEIAIDSLHANASITVRALLEDAPVFPSTFTNSHINVTSDEQLGHEKNIMTWRDWISIAAIFLMVTMLIFQIVPNFSKKDNEPQEQIN